MKQTILIFLLNLALAVSVNFRVDPLVQTDFGLIRGQPASDGDYSTFLGIPYSKVDLENPFGAATSYPEFENIFDANDGSIECPQNTDEASLDCLIANIFVPNAGNSMNILPVVVHIHGGGFKSGKAMKGGVKYFMDHGIIIVSINYRLGPFGFMCLDTPLVPGNQGLKDQYDALKWVRKNIAAFGGDPDNITIMGGSAGSCSVLLHLFVDNEKLFSQVISQSGTPHNEGMFGNGDEKAALKIASYLAFNATNSEVALNFLKSSPPELIIAASQELDLEFTPCQEKKFDGVANFVITNPFLLSNEEKVKNTPLLIGHTINEHNIDWLYGYGANYFETDPFYEKLKSNFNVNDENLIEVGKIVRHFYIGDELVSLNVTSELIEFDSDFVFTHSIESVIKLLLEDNAGPIYHYVFSYVGDNGQDATHGADVKYLFPGNDLRSKAEELFINRITTLFANFIKYGNPTPEVTELLPITWEPVSKETRPYLNLDKELNVKHRVHQRRMAFWDLFYSMYGKYHKLYNI